MLNFRFEVGSHRGNGEKLADSESSPIAFKVKLETVLVDEEKMAYFNDPAL